MLDYEISMAHCVTVVLHEFTQRKYLLNMLSFVELMQYTN